MKTGCLRYTFDRTNRESKSIMGSSKVATFSSKLSCLVSANKETSGIVHIESRADSFPVTSFACLAYYSKFQNLNVICTQFCQVFGAYFSVIFFNSLIFNYINNKLDSFAGFLYKPDLFNWVIKADFCTILKTKKDKTSEMSIKPETSNNTVLTKNFNGFLNMFARISTALSLALILSSPMFAQTITLNFPHFSGREWELTLLRGLNKDVVLSGTIPADGKVVLEIPETHRSYAGMARWMLKNGGGLDFVLNGESFSVECLSDQPNEDNIIYTGTIENKFLLANYREQEQLRLRYEAMRIGLAAYPEGTKLHAVLKEEMDAVKKENDKFFRDLSASPLYAARFREIVNMTRGVSDELETDEVTMARKTDDFMRHRMSWPALYTSNHWSGICFSWVQMHSSVIQQDSALLNSARDILARIEDDNIYTDFCEQIARYFIKFGKDSLLQVITPEIQKSGKLKRNDGLLVQFHSVPAGAEAPVLVRADGVALPWKETPGKVNLVVFFQSGCGPCESTMAQLMANFQFLESAGVNIITVSADKDKVVYEETAAKFPWKEKIFDGEGFDGTNFKTFGVAGTPTILVIDKKGQLLKREAQLPELLLWLEREGLAKAGTN